MVEEFVVLQRIAPTPSETVGFSGVQFATVGELGVFVSRACGQCSAVFVVAYSGDVGAAFRGPTLTVNTGTGYIDKSVELELTCYVVIGIDACRQVLGAVVVACVVALVENVKEETAVIAIGRTILIEEKATVFVVAWNGTVGLECIIVGIETTIEAVGSCIGSSKVEIDVETFAKVHV